MLSREECRAILDEVVALSSADEVHVAVTDEETSHLRFARNTPSTSGSVRARTLEVRSSIGNRTGRARVNQLDPASLRRAVRRSEEIAHIAPDDPEFVEALGPQEYATVEAWSDDTAERASEVMAAGSAICLEYARAAGLVAAGFSQADARVECLGNSKGLFGYHRSTTASFTETVRTPDGTGSGWANDAATAVGALDYAGRARIAIDKAKASAQARPLAPGKYPTILEPACVASLLDLLLGAMDRRRADEGRNFFGRSNNDALEGTRAGTRLGEKLFPDSVTIASDPANGSAPDRPWDAEGLPRRRTEWVKGGVVANLATSRFWARSKGLEAVPEPSNVLMSGGRGSLADLIRSTERGVLVTSMWYIRSVDPRTLLHTGLTRDGVFWIEKGAIAYPVNNFRWNESPLRVLAGVEAVSQPVRVASRGSRAANAVVPAIRVASFDFTSVSEAV